MVACLILLLLLWYNIIDLYFATKAVEQTTMQHCNRTSTATEIPRSHAYTTVNEGNGELN